MALQKPEWFKVDPAKFLSDAEVDAMTAQELGACFRLLCRQWIDGWIPDDERQVARLARLDATAMPEAWVTLCRFFPVVEPGKRANRFMFIEREQVMAELERRSDEGARAARKRWDEHRKKLDAAPNGSPMPDPMQEQSRAESEKSRPEQHDGAEPAKAAPAPASPVLVQVPCTGTGAKTWPLTQAKLDEWAEAFPGLDVKAEVRRAIQWLRDNPTKAKTYRGMPAFFGRWLTNQQDRTPKTTTTPHGGTNGTRSPQHRADADAAWLAKLRERNAAAAAAPAPEGRPDETPLW